MRISQAADATVSTGAGEAVFPRGETEPWTRPCRRQRGHESESFWYLSLGILAVTASVLLGGKGLVFLPTVAALMCAVGILAALGPARRGLAVQPTEALREE